MSTGVDEFADNFTDDHTDAAVLPAVYPTPEKRKKVQTPYKPRISYIVKRILEDSVQDAKEISKQLIQMLDWLEHERAAREEMRRKFGEMVPLDHRMKEALEDEMDNLLRIGKLEHLVARMALTITQMERNVTETLEKAKDAVPHPHNRRAGDNAGRPS